VYLAKAIAEVMGETGLRPEEAGVLQIKANLGLPGLVDEEVRALAYNSEVSRGSLVLAAVAEQISILAESKAGWVDRTLVTVQHKPTVYQRFPTSAAEVGAAAMTVLRQ
jgi:hypothetical protein